MRHSRGSEWWPMSHVAEYIKYWIRRPLERSERNIMRAECSRPVIGEKDTLTPNLDPEIITYMFKMGRDPRQGLEKALKHCEDKLLDTLGPLARMFNLVEEAYLKGTDLDIVLLRGWCQRAICFLGNANAGLIAERKKAVLFKINPKLGDFAKKDTCEKPNGLLFGDGAVRDLGKYVNTSTSPDKVQTNMRKVFSGGASSSFYGRAGRRGQPSGRSYYRSQCGYSRGFARGSQNQYSFYTQKGRGIRTRASRGRGQSSNQGAGKFEYEDMFWFYPRKGGRKVKKLCTKMEGDYKRSMGFKSSDRIRDGIYKCSISDKGAKRIKLQREARENSFGGDREYVKERGNCGNRRRGKRFCEYIISSREKAERLEVSNQLEGFEFLRGLQTFQDGGNRSFKRCVTRSRLDGEIGSQGCVFHNSDGYEESDVPPVQVERSNLSVCMFAFRSLIRSLVFYEGDESSGWFLTRKGSADDCLFGRSIDYESRYGRNKDAVKDGHRAFTIFGFHNKCREIGNSFWVLLWILGKVCYFYQRRR